jgi:hypothetical protein
MIISPNDPNLGAGDRLTGRQIRIGLSINKAPIIEHVVAPAADVVFSAGGPVVFAVPGWTGPDLCLISRGRWLALGPGMSLIMCHETGEDRMEGTFEELSAAGVTFPHFINVSRLNIRVKQGLAMLMEYMPSPLQSSR